MDALNCLRIAREVAFANDASEVEALHLLAALLTVPETRAFLRRAGCARAAVAAVTGLRPPDCPAPRVPAGRAVRDAMAAAIDLARRIPSPYTSGAEALHLARAFLMDGPVQSDTTPESLDAWLGEALAEPPPWYVVKRRAALHEAGHAVMAWLLHMPIVRVCLDGPQAATQVGSGGLPAEFSRSTVMTRLRILLAGRVAESLFHEDDPSSGWSNDITRAKDLAAYLLANALLGHRPIPVDNPEAVDDLLAAQYEQVRRWLSGRGALIQRLADALMERGQLGREELDGLFADAEPLERSPDRP